jgi:hypothetical protein
VQPQPATPTGQRETAWWGSHFVLSEGRVRVPASGGDMALDAQLLADVGRWLGYYALVRLKSFGHLARRRRIKVWFTPTRPRPWYIIWAACAWAGLQMADSAEDADAAFYFEDSTRGQSVAAPHAKRFNFQCTDVSKSRVAAVFESVFGYPLALDPQTHHGQAVEKSEENGRHDGRLIACPGTPRAGAVYQFYIDTAIDGVAQDLRTCCVGGEPVIVMIKTKPLGASFSIQNTSVRAIDVDQMFSPDEQRQIARFNHAMGLDWGSLDILRERSSGRLYIVDVNKTDVGPPVVLSWADRVRVTEALAQALTRMVTNAA